MHSSSKDAEAAASGAAEGWAVWTYRILISLTAVMLASQSITAGQFMSGSYGSVELHSIVAYSAAGVVFLLDLPVVIVAVWRQGASWGHLMATIVLFGLILAQIVVGENRTLTFHVPLGVAIVMFAVLQAWSSWKLPRSLRTQS